MEARLRKEEEHISYSIATITLESEIKKDLGADSLDILQLLMRVEDEYGIVIPDQELAGFKTVADVVNFLDKQKQ